MHHSSWKLFALSACAALFTSACIVVPAENHTAPPPVNNAPPPPPPVYGEQQPPPSNYGQQPPPQGYGQPGYTTTTTTVVYYEDPAPEPIAYYEANVVWYYGPHPVTPGNGYGWCPIRGSHTHAYEPYWQDRYEFWNGYYYYVGDPSPYDSHVTYYIYIGAHPNPWGGWCYATNEHHHYYTPRRNDSYRYEGTRWQYTGTYDQTYYSTRAQYDNNGHRSQGNAYADHRNYQAAHASPTRGSATHESVPPTNTSGGHPAGSMRDANTGNATPMGNRETNGRDPHENGILNPGHENNGHENNGRDNNGHENNGHGSNPVMEQPITPNNNNQHPGLMLNGGHATPAATPNAAVNHGGAQVAPAATATPAPAGHMLPSGGRPAATPTPAAASPGRGHMQPAATATPTPTPAGKGPKRHM